jgi:hypothetical protein
MTRGVPDTTARYDRSVYVAKLQSDGEPAYEPAMNRIRPSRVLVLLLRTHTRRKTLLTALQVLQVRNRTTRATRQQKVTHRTERPNLLLFRVQAQARVVIPVIN